MFNANKVRGNGDVESGIFNKGGSTVDQIFDYFIDMIPIGDVNPRKNQITSLPESPRRKRRDRDGPGTEILTVDEAASLFEILTELQSNAFTEAQSPCSFSTDWAFDVILPLLQRGELNLDLAERLVLKAHFEFEKESLLVDLDFGEGIETVVVGDIHGQFSDLLLIFQKFGRPSHYKRFIFNGDIIDRGPRSVACWLFICALKISCPEFLFVTRGNHESKTINILTSSFRNEIVNNYSEDFFILCQSTFNELPLAYVLNKAIFITHGGLPKDLCLTKMRRLPKDPLHSNFDFKIFMALLWNDPSPICGYGSNTRGQQVFTFGPDITKQFLEKHNLSLLIRSHEYKVFGHQYTHDSKCLTIFSCPDYLNLGNSGAVALVDSRGKVKVEQFYE